MLFGIRCVPRAMDSPWSLGVAGVEEIVGSLRRGVVRMRFWVPGPPPQGFSLVRFVPMLGRVPVRGRRWRVWCVVV